MQNFWKALISGIAAGLGAYFKELSIPVIVLTGVMAVDYVSGVAAAYINNELSSRVGMVGIVKKVGYFLLVIVGMGVDYLVVVLGAEAGLHLAGSYFFGLLVCMWLIINELLSILENAAHMGLPVPEWLKRALVRLKEHTEHSEQME